VYDKSNGAERGGVHGNDVTRVSAPRDLAEHWIGGDERRVSVDRRPAPPLATEAPVERVVVVIEERNSFVTSHVRVVPLVLLTVKRLYCKLRVS